MSAELREPGLYVVTSTYRNGIEPTPQPYKKVCMVVLPSGDLSVVNPHTNDGYALRDLTRFDGEVDESILGGVAGFIEGYMRRDSRLRSYNCHTFAGHMLGVEPSQQPLVRDRHQASFVDTLFPGELGLVFTAGEHSLIGLGGEQTIQVLTDQSNIGILPTFETLRRFYGDYPRVADKSVARRLGIRSLRD